MTRHSRLCFCRQLSAAQKNIVFFDSMKECCQGLCLVLLWVQNDFSQVPIFLDGSNLFWSCPNHFEQVQIIKISPEKSNLNLTKMIWTKPKRFGPIEGQGIRSTRFQGINFTIQQMAVKHLNLKGKILLAVVNKLFVFSSIQS